MLPKRPCNELLDMDDGFGFLARAPLDVLHGLLLVSTLGWMRKNQT